MEIETLWKIVAVFYAVCMICAATYMTMQIEMVHKTVSSEDRYYNQRPNWYRQLVAFLISCIFVFIPIFNLLTTMGLFCELCGIKADPDKQ